MSANKERLIDGNVTAGIIGGLTGVITSLAFDGMFGVDHTSKEALVYAGASGALGALSGYAMSKMTHSNGADFLTSYAIGATAGAAQGAFCRVMLKNCFDSNGLLQSPSIEE